MAHLKQPARRPTTHLKQGLHISQSCVHGGVGGEQLNGHLHELEVAGVSERLALQDHQERRQEVAHPLRVPLAQVRPHKAAHHVADLNEVCFIFEVPAGQGKERDEEGGGGGPRK